VLEREEVKLFATFICMSCAIFYAQH
jgi:hypothetical protein